jgi:hypothetical protein
MGLKGGSEDAKTQMEYKKHENASIFHKKKATPEQ